MERAISPTSPARTARTLSAPGGGEGWGEVGADFDNMDLATLAAEVARLDGRAIRLRFTETGDLDRQRSLLEAAAGMPLLGPNCYGFINTTARVALWPDEHALSPVERGVALVTQSGNIGCNLTMMQRGLPIATLLTLGNQADVDIAAAMDAFAQDPRITAIGLHIEGLRDPQAFAAAAARAQAAGKPVVALKTGRSPQGARIALSHTASMAGEDRICAALFERYGVARAPTLSALVETLKLLHFGGPTTGRRLVSLSCSGGEAALVADLAPAHGLSFPPFSEVAACSVAATLSDLVHIDNPLDYHTFIWNQREALENTFAAALAGGFDAALLILDTPTHPAMKPDSWLVTARAWAAAQRRVGARAVVVATLPEGMPARLADELGAAGIAPLQCCARANCKGQVCRSAVISIAPKAPWLAAFNAAPNLVGSISRKACARCGLTDQTTAQVAPRGPSSGSSASTSVASPSRLNHWRAISPWGLSVRTRVASACWP